MITELREELEIAKVRVDARRDDLEKQASALVSEMMGGGLRTGLAIGAFLGFGVGAWAFFTNSKPG